MKDLTEQIYDELNAQVVRMLNHSLNQASRIVELETQLKDHSAQAFSIGETYANALSRIAELEAQLAAASAPAETDKLREALKLAVRQNSCDMLMTGEEIRKCEAALNFTALQAPVREVPDTLVSSMVRALQDCLDYGSMTGSEWVSDQAREAIKKAAPVQQEGS